MSEREFDEAKNKIGRDLGERLTSIRESKRLTQEEFLRQLDETSPKTSSGYSRWENGQRAPDVCFLVQLHEKWHVDLNWLIAGDKQPVPQLPSEVEKAITTLSDYKHKCQFGK